MRLPAYFFLAFFLGCAGYEATAPTTAPNEATPPVYKPSAAVATYSLASVNEQPLPVHSPWGLGDWDYDEDAGTWKLTGVVLTLFASNDYSYVATHRAASGAITVAAEDGVYERYLDRLQFNNRGAMNLHYATWSAQFSGKTLIEGTVQRFVFAPQ